MKDLLGAKWHHDIQRCAYLGAGESSSADTHDFQRMTVDENASSDDVGAAPVFPLPEAMGENRAPRAAVTGERHCGFTAALVGGRAADVQPGQHWSVADGDAAGFRVVRQLASEAIDAKVVALTSAIAAAEGHTWYVTVTGRAMDLSTLASLLNDSHYEVCHRCPSRVISSSAHFGPQEPAA